MNTSIELDASPYHSQSMSPKEFSAFRIGGSWGADWVREFPFLRAFSKNFEEGNVVRIKNTGQFHPSDTYWKQLLDQYEANGPVGPEDIGVEPLSGD